MLAYDVKTGELTRDGRPVVGLVRRLFELVGLGDVEHFEDVLDRDWLAYDVPGSEETLYLPGSQGDLWDQWVEELDYADRPDRNGPTKSRSWQMICCVCDVYFIVDGGRDTFDVTVIGVDAYDEAVEAADLFGAAEDEDQDGSYEDVKEEEEEEEDYGGYYEMWGFDEDEDIETHIDEDLGTHPLFRHWRSQSSLYWAPLWHVEGEGFAAAQKAFAQLERRGTPTSGTGAYVAAMGYQCVALDGCIWLRAPRDDDTEKGDIEGALIAGRQLLRLVCDIAEIDPPCLDSDDVSDDVGVEELHRHVAWQLEYKRAALEERLARIKLVQKCDEAHAIAVEFAASNDEVLPNEPVPNGLQPVADLGEVSVRQAMTVLERFDANQVLLHADGATLHLHYRCSAANEDPSNPRTLPEVATSGAELRRQHAALCQHCSKPLLAALEAVCADRTPSVDSVEVTVDLRRVPNHYHRGDDLMQSIVAGWIQNPNVWDPVSCWATVSGDELAVLTRYWAEIERHGLRTRIGPATT